MIDPAVEEDLRAFARASVRSGLTGPETVHAQVTEAVVAEWPELAAGAQALARAWVSQARRELAAEQERWPEVTDHDRLQAAFAVLADRKVAVLQGCADASRAQRLLEEGHPAGRPRAVLWFTPEAVWHAVGSGVLEASLALTPEALAAGDGAVAARVVLGALADQGLRARSRGPRVEVATWWQRRL